MSDFRVIHLPLNFGNNSYYLNLAEKKYITSHTLIVGKNDNFNKFISNYSVKIKNKYIRFLKKIILFVYLLFFYKIFHYNFGTTLLSSHSSPFFSLMMKIELKTLKIFRKGIVVTFQGSDARLSRYCRTHYKITYFNLDHFMNLETFDENITKKIAIFDRYADLIFTTQPDLLNTLPERSLFRPLTKIDFNSIKPHFTNYHNNKVFNIIHAPSNRYAKGTSIIEEAIIKLNNEGYQINFQLIENMNNTEALERYKSADLVIDQLYAGWYGGFAVEAMALGKPVMCYIRESDMKHIPDSMKNEMPIINTSPFTFYQDLKKIILNKPNLREIATQSRLYIEKWHNIDEIAKTVIYHYKSIIKK